MNAIVYAGDLSADLGFGRNMPPKFWKWCKDNGLEPISAGNPFAFAIDAVDEAIARSKGNRR